MADGTFRMTIIDDPQPCVVCGKPGRGRSRTGRPFCSKPCAAVIRQQERKERRQRKATNANSGGE